MANDNSKGIDNVIKGPWRTTKTITKAKTEKIAVDMLFVEDMAESVMIPMIHSFAENGLDIKKDEFVQEVGFMNEVVKSLVFRHLGYKHPMQDMIKTIMTDLNTEVQLLKKEVSDMKMIYSRLDKAIEKISDVSNSINRMLAVHEEKISQQEEAQIRSEQEINNDIKELHSRISTNNRELMALMSEQHKEQTDKMTKLEIELQGRVGVLEKYRWIIIGGAIVIGWILSKNFMPILHMMASN